MVTNYQHILVPLDGSELAEMALEDAFALAQLSQAEITLLQVISPIDHVIIDATSHPIFVDEQWQLQKSFALTYLKDICDRVECDEVKIHRVVEMGLPAETIIDFAQRHPIDLIVMATHGRSGLQRWVFGSVADKVLRGANIPVLLVRAHSIERAG